MLTSKSFQSASKFNVKYTVTRMATIRTFAALCLLVTVFSKVHFNGDKVFRIHPLTEDDVSFVHLWIEKMADRIDVWKEPSAVGRDIDIHVSKDDVDEVKKVFTKAGLTFKCIIEDLEQKINEEQNSNHYFGFSGSYNYDAYNQYGDIIAELNRLAAKYQNAETFSVGKTYEGRIMTGIKVTDGSGRRKQAIWIDGGIHAREWISPATVMFTLKQLLNPEPMFASDVRAALTNYDFYVLPVFNVDGYIYTQINRMWRKTRSRQSWGCVGADPNRNWDSHFGGVGTSSNACSDTYHGYSAFSEIEVRQVANYLKSIHGSQGLKSYWNVHAYSQLLLFPWSYTQVQSRDDAEIARVAHIFANGVRATSGRYFQVGQPSRILYAVAGGSVDWTYEKLGVKYSYAPELRPDGRGGGNGFLLPASEIRASGTEFTNGFLKAVLAMK